jgi:hypothetical protein
MASKSLPIRNNEAAQLEDASASTSPASTTLVKFGREMRKEFMFDDDYLNLNHGIATLYFIDRFNMSFIYGFVRVALYSIYRMNSPHNLYLVSVGVTFLFLPV